MNRRAYADRWLRRGLERLHGSGPVLVPEYPLHPAARWGWTGPPLGALETLIEARRPEFEGSVAEIVELTRWAATVPKTQVRPGQPCWENDFWGTVDALMQVAALRRRDPALYLEVGSGFSTLFARRAITDFSLRTQIVSIDPAPRTDVDAACDEVIRRPLQRVDPAVFARLSGDDVLLVDGSHVALMGTDATVFLLELMPALAPGVLVGIDDIFLPWDYPPSWAGRIYGEQYLLAAFLLGGGGDWKVRFPGWWLVECSELAERFEPLWPTVENRFGRHAGSFWMERPAP